MKMSRKPLKVFFLILMAGVPAFSAVSAIADGTGPTAEETQEEADELYAAVKQTLFGRINVRSGPGADTDRVGVLEPGTKAAGRNIRLKPPDHLTKGDPGFSCPCGKLQK